MSGSRALLYDPYLDQLGGGERYLYDVAACVRRAHDVEIASVRVPPDAELLRAGLDASIPRRRMPIAAFPLHSLRRDVAVYVTNRPPVPGFARHSFLIAQFPFRDLGTTAAARAWNRWVLSRYRIITYSDFSRHWIRERWGVPAEVIHPAVTPGTYRAAEKRPTILAVGRFFTIQSSKRQDVLVEAFRMLPEPIRREWRLVLAGEVADTPSARDFVGRLRRRAEGYNITVETSVPRPRLLELYAEASLFWHAAGYGRAPDAVERAEHFGIATVEAMGHGAVPLVYADGGQLEIVDGSVGVLWRSLDELVEATATMALDTALRETRAACASEVSRRYSGEEFCRRVAEVILSG